MFYVNDKYTISQFDEFMNINVVTPDIESLVVKISLKETLPIYVVGIYRPPSGKIDSCMSSCSNIFEKIQSIPKGDKAEIFFLGDFNIDLNTKNGKGKMPSVVKKFVNKFSLRQLINAPTRISTISTIIDHVYTNSCNILFCEPLSISVSDHLPIALVRKKQRSVSKNVEFSGRSYLKYSIDNLRIMLNDFHWHDFYSLTDVNALWKIFLSRLVKCLDKLAPIRKFKFKKDRPIWFTDELMELIKDKDTLMNRALKTNDPVDKAIARNARNRSNILIRDAKSAYIREQLENQKHSPKKFWHNVKEVLPDSSTSGAINILDEQGKAVMEDKVSTYINHYFVNIGEKLNKELNANSCSYDRVMGCRSAGFSFQRIQVEELRKEIKNIKNFKSSGIDNVASKVLKDAFFILDEQFLYILNKSIELHKFPDEWKKATVIPLPKINNPKQVSDFRPISLLPLPGKIIEKLLHSQLINHLENNSLLNSKQNGFRKFHNTSDTVFKLCYDLSTGMNKKHHTAAVFVDFAKAFDSINHVKLVNKLKTFSLETKAVLWLKDYLSDRRQRVMVNGDFSNWDTIKYGVPQGSILGPLLFIMFTNDMVDSMRNSNVLLYADDTVIYRSDFCFDKNYRNIQGDLNRLHKWCFKNGLTINGRKTKVVNFGNNPKRVVKKTLHINRIILLHEKQYKYLGVILDSKLNFEAHFKEIVKTFSFKLYLYRRVRNCLNDLAAKLVLKTMVLSYLDYGSMFLSVRTVEDISTIQVLQNKALRSCLRVKNYIDVPIHELHLQLNVQPFDKRMQYFLLCSIYRNIKNEFLTPIVPRKMTRMHRAPILALATPNTDWYYRSAVYFGIKTWNILPINIRNSESLEIFKASIKQYLFI